MQYRVIVYADHLGRWLPTGPIFPTRYEAAQFLKSLSSPFCQLVVWPPSGGVVEGEAAPSPGLDPRHLEFARFLVQSGRITDWPREESPPTAPACSRARAR